MNVELFKDAIAIIEGIPADRLDLEGWQHNLNDFNPKTVRKPHKITCGTIACAGGWLALNPVMRRHGLRADKEGAPVLKNGTQEERRDSYLALATLFDISEIEAENLFTYRKEEGHWKRSDKQVWLKRAYKLLAKYEAKHEREQSS